MRRRVKGHWFFTLRLAACAAYSAVTNFGQSILIALNKACFIFALPAAQLQADPFVKHARPECLSTSVKTWNASNFRAAFPASAISCTCRTVRQRLWPGARSPSSFPLWLKSDSRNASLCQL
jgi:hypothetical protein